jgi:hypothetical protein
VPRPPPKGSETWGLGYGTARSGALPESQLGPAPMERRNHRLFDASQSLHRIGNRGVGIVDRVVASLFLS